MCAALLMRHSFQGEIVRGGAAKISERSIYFPGAAEFPPWPGCFTASAMIGPLLDNVGGHVAENEGSGGLWTKADKDEREWYLSKLEAETSRLLQSESTAAHAITNMLFGVNAGGAVAMLAYVSSDHAQIPHSYAVLTAFVAGLFMALMLAILGYYSTQTKLIRWIEGTASFYSGHTNWRALWSTRDPTRWWLGPGILHALGWLSLLAFILGAGFGIYQVWQLPSP